jgi:two-component system chemotaxis response regulator CheY
MSFPSNTRILIIDDMATMRQVIRASLHELGYTDMAEADDGSTAWPLITKAQEAGTPFQLIISDWNMPNLSGIDLLKKVRGVDALKQLPFIFVTAENGKEHVVQALQAGVSSYITKPFTAQTMQQKLDAVHANLAK